MKILKVVLGDLIRRGKVTVDIPNLDTDRLTEYLHSETASMLREIEAVACAEEMTAAEKVSRIQELLA